MSTDKDTWDKWDIILKPVGGLLTALSVALVGILGSQYLAGQQANDANTRLYTELMTSREKADSALRQEMFNVIITTFLKKDEKGNRDVRDEILALELLAYNFHDAIDIGPLFNHVRKNIDGERNVTEKKLSELTKRLERVAKEVTSKQLASLGDGGAKFDAWVMFDVLDENPQKDPIKAIDGVLLVPDSADHDSAGQESADHDSADRESDVEIDTAVPLRKAYLEVLDYDKIKRTLDVQLTVSNEENGVTELSVNFEVGFYDFPMIDNSRLPGGQRVAVALQDWEPGSHVQVALAYFPGSRASLKEKRFYEEIVKQLQSVQSPLLLIK